MAAASLFSAVFRPDLALGLGKPHHVAALHVARRDDEVWEVLAGPVALVIGHREAEALVLEVPRHVVCAVKEVREALLEVQSWHGTLFVWQRLHPRRR